MMHSIGWMILLVCLIALVRVTTQRTELLAVAVVALATAGTAVAVAGRGVAASPTLVWELTSKNVEANLRSGAFARRLLGITALVLGVMGVATSFGPPSGSGVGPLFPWTIVAAILLLVSRARQHE